MEGDVRGQRVANACRSGALVAVVRAVVRVGTVLSPPSRARTSILVK